MNNKKLIAQRKQILRDHLNELHRSGSISKKQLIKDGAYYAKNVINYLNRLDYVTPSGLLVRTFNIDDVVDTIWTVKPAKNIREIGNKAAKSIGQKMTKSRINIDEIIKQNSTVPAKKPTYEDRAALDNNDCRCIKPKSNPLASIATEDLLVEIARRGFNGNVSYSI